MAKKVNGEHGVILSRIETLEKNSQEARTNIFTKLDNISSSVNDIKVVMATEKEKLSNSVRSLNNHKADHKWNMGMTITITSFIAGVIAWLVGLLKK